jgi:hypothetical protein
MEVVDMGKKTTIEKWTELGILDSSLELMKSLAYQGATLAIIAQALDIDVRTLERMRKEGNAVYDKRVYLSLLRGREALVADTGDLLMNWAYDEEVPIGIRVGIVTMLNTRHGNKILGLEDTKVKIVEGETGEDADTKRVFVIRETVGDA